MTLKNIYLPIALLFLALLFIKHDAVAQYPGFTQQEIIKTSGITTDAQTYSLTINQKQTSRVYTDGFGRTIQTVGVQASPAQNDWIQPVAYDALGRQTKAYLPYAGQSTDVMGSYRNNAISSAQPSFYNNTAQYLIAKDTNAFVQQVYEASPLQRLLKAGTAGSTFQPFGSGHFKTISYRPNNSATDGSLLLWNPDGTFTSGNYYADNTLNVTDNIDEDNTEVLTFTDLAGRTILQRQKLGGTNLDTYYIYNNAGMLTYIIPPKGTALLAANAYQLSNAPLSNLIFKMAYDGKGRLISKTVPGKGPSYIVYDPLDRPVLMQDANMAGANKWNYIKYDAKGRQASSGIYTDNTSSHIGQGNMQAFVNTIDYSTVWYENRSSTITNAGYYTNNTFPNGTYGTLTPMLYNYYDNYDLNIDGNPDFSYYTTNLPGETGATTAQIKGMPTITIKVSVGAGLSNIWLTTVTYYDKNLRPIQVRSNNQLYYTNATTLTDTKTTVPDFTGMPLVSSVTKQTGASASVTVTTYPAYDHMYRLTSVSQQYNNGTAQKIAAYTYNELGQIVKKNLGYVNSTTWLQNLDMRYNIRGQLLSINNSKLANDGGVTNSETNDVFGMEMLYDKADANLGNTASFNGKLSAVKWMSKDAGGTSSYERSYKYSYDAMNRYTAAVYAERTTAGTGAFNNNIGGFNEAVSYDIGGNITALTRNSSTQGTNSNVQVDNLTYTPDANNPNRLLTVTDGTGANYTGYGFRNITGSAGSYTYDANGNLVNDPYKGSSLNYNVLNRTQRITFSATRYIDYTYDATGTLLKKQQYDSGTLQNTTDYIDGFNYVNGVLAYFTMPEGRVLYTANGSTFTQEFVITDQQGNARVSFQNNGGALLVKQENSYYGFGLVMANSPVATPTVANKQLYNGGAEWQNDYNNLPDYYQTFYRNYDAALGRWIGVDPVAESEADKSSYQYAGNNPIMFNDPLGDLLPLPGSKDMPEVINTASYFSRHQSIFGSNIPQEMRAYGEGVGGGDWTVTWNRILSGSGFEVSRDGGVARIFKPVITVGSLVRGDGTNRTDNDNQAGNVSITSSVWEMNRIAANFSVSGINASSIQIIQTYSGTGGLNGNKSFVDGGINSPYAQPGQNGSPAQPGKPYYLNPKEFASQVTWKGSSGTILFTDYQNGAYYNDISTFNVIVVAVNVNGSGVDQLLGGFQWGYNHMAPINNGQIIYSPTVSPQAIKIIQNDYPGYRFK